MTRDTADMFKQPDRGRFGDNERQVRPGKGPRVTGASDLIDLTLTFRCEKPLAIAVSDPAKPRAPWVWVPKSQVEVQKVDATTVVVTLPEWLAKDKQLI
jgi:hypothetical protein